MINAIETISAAISTVKDVTATSNTSTTQSVLGSTATAGASQSFADVMGSMATDMVGSLKRSEAASIQGIRGEANTREVIDAVMSAEQSLQTAIAIRDKVVSAYLEIARMPI
ncbi:flagellar hook-basal body complex protein FliE [Pararhizobium sp. BT-229]|uniref:flagellar hook-basal body complex protein FliE n=1 Tax=Pararhizobium sp. BT-229 TaxID=2986923 RepID=UPI0021F6D1B1|nr:flagellar hook-basal body complex protein FliE [Pararhizobium sp. BT-229]MCV9962824.1 flagellar hook-basal body complex protein FliE [Pararhizobium sp. BT-229]